MKTVCRVLLLGFLAALAFLGWFGYQSYTTGFSAKEEPNELEALIARQLRHLAIPIENRRLRNPLPLTQDLLKEARAHFADHCALCHANNGSGQTTIGLNVYPKARDLRSSDIQGMSDGELFFITTRSPTCGMPLVRWFLALYWVLSVSRTDTEWPLGVFTSMCVPSMAVTTPRTCWPLPWAATQTGEPTRTEAITMYRSTFTVEYFR